MPVLRDLQEVGAAKFGDQLDPNRQTLGGETDCVFTRTFKVAGTLLQSYIFRILDAPTRITDDVVTNAYLCKQRAVKIDEINYHLVCVFAQIPSTWRTDAQYDTVGFPGVAVSSLYAPGEFDFRSSPSSFPTQVRTEHAYFLGPISGIATVPRFRPTDALGSRVSVITDYTDPSADEYISMVMGRREIVVDSVVVNWLGDIWDRRTKFALAR